MELSAVCSESAMTARIAICFRGSGVSWCVWGSEAISAVDECDELDGSRPLVVGGGVSKV